MFLRPGLAAAAAALIVLGGCALPGRDRPGTGGDDDAQAPPRQVVAAIELGEAALAEERFADAAARFQEALQRDPDNARARLGLAEAFLGTGATAQALATFESLEEPGEPAQAARQGRGIALVLGGRAEEGRDLLLEAVADDPGLWRAWNALGRSYDRERQWARAQESYERALGANPEAAIVHNNLGFSYLGQGRYDEAAARFGRALELAPELRAARTNLRLALAFQGRYAEAVAGVPPNDLPRVLNNVGYAALLLGDHDRARAFFQRALEASPNFYEPAWRNLQYLGQLEDRAAPAAPAAP